MKLDLGYRAIGQALSRKRLAWVLLLLLFILPACTVEKPISRIAFGSCCDEELPQPIWYPIVESNPDLFLMIGDNIYADTTDMAEMRRLYGKLGAQPGFQALRQRCRILAVWDDHDYGANDAGADFPRKVESQVEHLRFFQEPPDSPRWKQEGVYHAHVFGPKDKRVQVILLDTRYHRSPLGPLRESDRWRLPNEDPDATILGAEQWRWLAEQLKQPATVRILVSSIQVVADEHRYEKWANFPHERDRLYKLLRDSGVKSLIILSGDRHQAELSRAEGILDYPLYDLTSSSLNRPRDRTNPNRDRIGESIHVSNFGLVTIDWSKPDPLIRLEIRGDDGATLLAHDLPLSELQ